MFGLSSLLPGAKAFEIFAAKLLSFPVWPDLFASGQSLCFVLWAFSGGFVGQMSIWSLGLAVAPSSAAICLKKGVAVQKE